jgi:putative ABC transport system permease protein
MMKIARRLLQISWRNVFRNKRRSILTLLILVLGSTGLIVVGGFFQNLMDGFRDEFIHSQTGHLQINVAGYYEKGASAPFDYLMKDVIRVQQEIEVQPHVLYTVPRLKLGGMVSTDQTSVAVMALGVDPIREQRMGSLKVQNALAPAVHISEGQDLDPSDPYGAILGKGLMNALGLKIGDSVNFITTRQAGAIDGAIYHVRGAFETIFKEFDDRAMKINLVTAQKLLDTPDQVHSLLVILDETELTPAVQEGLNAKFKAKNLNLESIPWEAQAQFYRQGRDLLDKIYSTIQFIISVIFLFSIANTVNMAILERMREYGTMMAIGNGRGIVFSMIVFETMSLGLIGSLLGLLVGCGVSEIISSIGIQMPPPPQGTNPYIAMITLSPHLLFQTFAISLISTSLSSLAPAYRASHFPIIKALGYV